MGIPLKENGRIINMKAKFVVESLDMLRAKSEQEIDDAIDIPTFYKFLVDLPRKVNIGEKLGLKNKNPFSDVLETMGTIPKETYYTSYPEKWLTLVKWYLQKGFHVFDR